MGHVWTWLDSKEEFFTESERSSCFQSPEDSSSLDFELSSWRGSEEMTEVEESSSQEEDNQLRMVTKLMEPLSISSTNTEPLPHTSSSSGEKNERGASIQKEGIKKAPVYKEEEVVGEESHLQILKKEDRGNSISQRSEKWTLLVSEGFQDLSKDKENVPIDDSKFEGQKVLNLLEESVGRMEEDGDCSPGFMVQIPRKWRTLSKEVPLCVKEEVATEDAEEQAEDWKSRDFHLSYSNDESSAWGTPLESSPCTSTASWPWMQLNQDDSLQQCLLFKKTLLSIWKMVAGHRYSGPFLKAVSEKQAPGYKDVVKRSVGKQAGELVAVSDESTVSKGYLTQIVRIIPAVRPVDLSSIKRGVSKGQIQNMIHFQRDLMLMFQNAIMYNNANHHIHRIAVEMEQEVLEQLQILGEALLCTEEMQGFVRRY